MTAMREVYNTPISTGNIGGLTQPFQIEIWNAVISGDFIKFAEWQVPLHKCKAPYSEVDS